MKKLFIAVLALFVSISMFAATIVQQEAPEWYTTEYMQMNITFYNIAYGVMTRDENDQPKLVVQNLTFVNHIEILKLELKDGKDTIYTAYLDDNGELQWKPLKGRQSFIVIEGPDGSRVGYFMYETTINRGDGIPPSKCVVSGTLKNFKWDKRRNKYMAGNGSGRIVGITPEKDFPAWHLAEPATSVTPEKVFPIDGGVNVTTAGYWTGAQIKRILQDYYKKRVIK